MDSRKGGARLREFREKRGWSQRDLEKISGVKQVYITRLETGVTASPSFETVVLIGRALGLSADDLVKIYEL